MYLKRFNTELKLCTDRHCTGTIDWLGVGDSLNAFIAFSPSRLKKASARALDSRSACLTRTLQVWGNVTSLYVWAFSSYPVLFELNHHASAGSLHPPPTVTSDTPANGSRS